MLKLDVEFINVVFRALLSPAAAEGRGREIIKRLLYVRPFVTFLHKP